jgi:hypothetical protein
MQGIWGLVEAGVALRVPWVPLMGTKLTASVAHIAGMVEGRLWAVLAPARAVAGQGQLVSSSSYVPTGASAAR